MPYVRVAPTIFDRVFKQVDVDISLAPEFVDCTVASSSSTVQGQAHKYGGPDKEFRTPGDV